VWVLWQGLLLLLARLRSQHIWDLLQDLQGIAKVLCCTQYAFTLGAMISFLLDADEFQHAAQSQSSEQWLRM
jgi:hypothetical protein